MFFFLTVGDKDVVILSFNNAWHQKSLGFIIKDKP